ncbi:hypothetical protein G5B30_00890 [Sphingobacterium sp. SGG-5]|uniref:hypothetical protein n=1 Tax=Sphingobacterium sp. SGG-5 TaxID=2710881 RepID=UPI0013EDABDD|nr:hypothetical protein [Sphingobacterium sp. SGG-5]NGM60460.1 hypothetical protein [Sphingobacterium sp. SGG-5]
MLDIKLRHEKISAIPVQIRKMSPWQIGNSRNGDPLCRDGTATSFGYFLRSKSTKAHRGNDNKGTM